MESDPSNDSIEFAPTSRVDPVEELAVSVLRQVFGVEVAFISDLSSLDEFIATAERDEVLRRVPSERDIRSVEEAHRRIQILYGVDVRPEELIWRIAERIAREDLR